MKLQKHLRQFGTLEYASECGARVVKITDSGRHYWKAYSAAGLDVGGYWKRLDAQEAALAGKNNI